MSPQNEMQDVGVTYHRGFGLNRAAVSSVLRVLSEGKTRTETEQELTLGPDQFTAAINYCERSGLTANDMPTSLGDAVLEHDASLAEPATQWAMHYHLSNPVLFAPNYWSMLTLNALGRLGSIGQAQLTEQIDEYTQAKSGKALSERTLQSGATAYTSTYSKETGFGSLGILEESGRGQYTVRQPRALSAGAFACLLADYWQRHWPERSDVLLEQVTQGELARVLLLNENKVNDLLGTLAAPDLALVRRQRKHLPYQIGRQPGLQDAASLWATHLYL